MRSSKSRSRGNKNRSNRPTGGNVINRVFESSGPDGKVRGTPQQIIEKYLQLHRDAQLSGDRVNAENFAQHAEHYARMLAEAQREVDRVREEQEQFNRDRQAERDRDRERSQRNRAQDDGPTDPGMVDQPDVGSLGGDLIVDLPESGDSGLIDLPEGRPAFLDARSRADRRPRPDRPDRRERGERSDRQERGDQPERQDRGERPPRAERQDQQPQQAPARTRPAADPGPRPEAQASVAQETEVPAAKAPEAAPPAEAAADAPAKRAPRPRKPRAPKAEGETAVKPAEAAE